MASKSHGLSDDMCVETYIAGNGKLCYAIREYDDSGDMEYEREVSLWPSEMDELCKWWQREKRRLGKSEGKS